jgi:hypothetical protein
VLVGRDLGVSVPHPCRHGLTAATIKRDERTDMPLVELSSRDPDVHWAVKLAYRNG